MTPAAEQRVVRGGGVPDADEQEVRDRGACRVEPVLAEHVLEKTHRGAVRGASALELVGSVQARERRLLADRGDVERPAHLPDRGDDVLGPDAVSDAKPGEPEDLRERPQDEHAVPGFEVLRDAVRVVRILDVLEVRLVENGEHVRGTRSKYASSSARLFVVPVGLFGAAMKTSFVRGVIAASIASRSIRSSSSGTRTGTPPSFSGSST